MTAVSPDFRWWNAQNPTAFLAHDWENPSRAWATAHALHITKGGSLLEIGPGPGIDYERHFRVHVQAAHLRYVAYEGSRTLCASLADRFPESTWQCLTIADLAPSSADVIYARHVLEHQPALEPAFGTVLAAARKAVVLTWYRPPGAAAFGDVWEGVDCQTYRRTDVMAAIARSGYHITTSDVFASGDEAWVLKRS